MTIGLTHYLILAAMLFGIGLYGLLTRRNVIALLICIELMLNAVNLNFAAFNHFQVYPASDLSGQLMMLFSVLAGAAEAAVGLALAFRIYHDRRTVQVDALHRMKG